MHWKMKKLSVHLREGFLGVSLGQYKRMVNGEGDITVNCIMKWIW